MADKLTLADLASLANETSAMATINANNTLIEDAFDNTLSRDGSTPNAMEASIDMNSNRLLNLPQPISNGEPVRLQDIVDIEDSINVINGLSPFGVDLMTAADAEAGRDVLELGADHSPTFTGLSLIDDAATVGLISSTAAGASLRVRSGGGFRSEIHFQDDGATDRWIMGKEATAESGSNVGSDFEIRNYTDAGASIGTPFKIFRDDGLVSIPSATTATLAVTTSLAATGPGEFNGGSTAAPALKLGSQTATTTAQAGGLEYDGKTFFATPVASNRHLLHASATGVLLSTYTLTDTATAQKAFNFSTNGSIAVSSATSYFYEGQYIITNTGAGSHTWGVLFALGGGATLASGTIVVKGRSGITSAATLTTETSAWSSTPETVLVATAASTSTSENVILNIKGILRFTTGGTLTPQVKLSGATGGTIIMQAGSHFILTPIGNDTETTTGNWS